MEPYLSALDKFHWRGIDKKMYNVAVIIPALNPEETLIKYVKSLLSRGFREVIVINDGSGENRNHIFSRLAELDHCTVLTHKSNRGKGRALKTGFQYFLEHFSELNGVVTADADGQHAVEDVCKVAQKLQEVKTHLVLGIRNFKEAHVPKRSYIGNTITSFAFHLLFRQKLVDTQTGLRAIPAREIRRMIQLRGERYEYEINMLIYAKKTNMPISEVAIQTIYYNNNQGSYYKTFRDSWKIFRKLVSGLLYFNFRYKKLLQGEPHE